MTNVMFDQLISLTETDLYCFVCVRLYMWFSVTALKLNTYPMKK